MTNSRRPARRSAPPVPKTVPARPRGEAPKGTVQIGTMARPQELAALARMVAALQERLAQRETELERERRERAEDADTIAQMLVRIAALEKNLRETNERDARTRSVTAAPPKINANLEELRAELTMLTVDRDAADRQRDVARMQLRAAETKLALVARQLGWAEVAAQAVESALPLTSAPMRASIASLLERLAAARAALDSEPDPGHDSAQKRPSKRPR